MKIGKERHNTSMANANPLLHESLMAVMEILNTADLLFVAEFVAVAAASYVVSTVAAALWLSVKVLDVRNMYVILTARYCWREGTER